MDSKSSSKKKSKTRSRAIKITAPPGDARGDLKLEELRKQVKEAEKKRKEEEEQKRKEEEEEKKKEEERKKEEDKKIIFQPTISDTRLNFDNVPNRENVIALWIKDISDPEKKIGALKKLSDAVFDNEDLPIAEWVWHSFGTVSILLGDITSRYPLLYAPEKLTDPEALIICYALNVLSTVARHPTTRDTFIDACFTAYLLPLLMLKFGITPLHDAILQKVLVIFRLIIQSMGLKGVQHLFEMGAWPYVYRLYFETTSNSPANSAAKAVLERLSHLKENESKDLNFTSRNAAA